MRSAVPKSLISSPNATACRQRARNFALHLADLAVDLN